MARGAGAAAGAPFVTLSHHPTTLAPPCSAQRAVATMTLQFWAAPVCPYAQRGWIALQETGALSKPSWVCLPLLVYSAHPALCSCCTQGV